MSVLLFLNANISIRIYVQIVPRNRFVLFGFFLLEYMLYTVLYEYMKLTLHSHTHTYTHTHTHTNTHIYIYIYIYIYI